MTDDDCTSRNPADASESGRRRVLAAAGASLSAALEIGRAHV